ncbi:MAG: esterase-like activity of phytase family protein [Planctomycetota bacterium]|nr:esterase-like activity of phytase family protein [Planctomycetota bacterium]
MNARPSRSLLIALLSSSFLTGWCLIAVGEKPCDYVAEGGASVSEVFELPAISLKSAQNALLPQSIQNDRGILLGGLSDLWRSSRDPAGEYWVITDRGPNAKVTVDGKKRRTFPVPEFTPLLLQVRANDGKLELLKTIPLLCTDRSPVTGVSNQPASDGVAYDFSARKNIPPNPNGLDTEGLVRAPNGDFWAAEEYRPSLIKISPQGVVQRRYVPAGVSLEGTGYPVSAVLPEVYTRRQDNLGFEGLAISSDGRTLYAPMQSALSAEDVPEDTPSRNVRILAFDIESEKPVAEYLYQFDEAPLVVAKEGEEPEPAELKIGAAVALPNSKLLVLERIDSTAKIYLVDLAQGTNLLNSDWHAATSPSLESITDFQTAKVVPQPKTLVVDLATIPDMPDKLEGMALVDQDTIAVVNDNDFGFEDFDEEGNAVQKDSAKSRMYYIKLPKPLK